MAIISLRAYNREIEGMIDNGQLDEAVAHCRHILATFPKHIASYRLLGKAHLEQQRISDATDIFLRVLSAIPDDFISNVGMSIIREDENNLDAAIWHMELAYEAQPANIAIQDELRRLYGRRDGMQPPKVRLTRGALARMYAKGGLFDQAIAELRAAITEDPNRPDLQLLLAQMFFQTSQRVEAVEASVNILKKMPMCLEANRILAISLPEADGSDAVRNSRQIVISMDPYFAFAEPEAISSDLVSENAVNIERLEWKSGIQVGEVPNQPAWATSLGINMDKPADENIPDWLKAAEAPVQNAADEIASPSISPFIWDTQEVEKIITDTSKPEGDIPDWMKDAGWKPSTGETAPPPGQMTAPEEPTSSAPTTPASDDLEQADIPDWLRGIAPEDFVSPQGQQAKPEEDTLSNPWLEPHQPGPTDSIIHWLEDKPSDASVIPDAQQQNAAFSMDDEVPDWLKDLDIPKPSPVEAEKPAEPTSPLTSAPSAFLAVPAEAGITESEAAPVEKTAEPASAPSIPPQPAAVEQPAAQEEEIPDWMKDMAVEVPAAKYLAAMENQAEEPQPEADTESAPQPIAAEASPITAPELAEQPVAAVVPPSEELTPSPEEALVAEPPVVEEVPSESNLPEAAGALDAAEMVVKPEPAPVEQPPAVVEELPAPEAATPELEHPLAAASVVAADILAKPDETPTEEPAFTAETAPPPETVVPSESPAEFAAPLAAETEPPENLAPLEETPTQEPSIQPSDQLQIDQLIPAETELPHIEPDSMSEADAFAWLEGLAAEQDAMEQSLATPPTEGEVQPPEWVKLDLEPITEAPPSSETPVAEVDKALPAEDVPDWIKGLGDELEPETAPEVPVSKTSPEGESAPASPVPAEAEEENLDELPAWLLEMEKTEEEPEAPAQYDESLEWKVEELPDWLKEITESEAAPEVAPSNQQVSAGEEAAAVVIAGLAPPDEPVPPAETLGEPAVIPQPEVPAPIQIESAPAPAPEEISTMPVESSPVASHEPARVEEVLEPDPAEAVLSGARTALNLGDSSQALSLYSRLIKDNLHLGEVIKDLQDALYRYPVDVDMWVTLGDAQSHTHDLQEALNAYTKAEELAR